MSEIVHVTRILEYVGPKEWVEETLRKGAVPANGVYTLPNNCAIKSELITDSNLDYICLDCDYEFDEYEAKTVSYYAGATRSKSEYFACPICESTRLKHQETGRIQNI